MQWGGSNKGPVASWIATIILTMALSFGAGLVFAQPAKSQAAASQVAASNSVQIVGIGSDAPTGVNTSVDFSEFWTLWKTIKSRYYKQPVDDKALFYGAMSGLASAVNDPYTVFFEPTTAKDFSDALQGKFEGIGAEIGIKDDQLQVIAPLPDTPADRAGLRAGDAILSIDKVETTDMPVDKAVSLIRGKRGTYVTLLVGRVKIEKDAKGKEKRTPTTVEISIMRETIEVKSVRTKFLRDGIAHIEITNFNQDTGDLFSQAVDDVMTKDPKGLILDMRNNPGGFLDRATEVAGEWVGDLVVVSERKQGKITEQFRGTGQNRLRDIPTIVLVNQGSASAAEIVAGALQDYKKAKIVGMKTFGKGSVQDYVELPDTSAIKITIAEWVTPAERSIDKTGIQPDITIDKTQDDSNAGRDPQLDKALEILTGKPSATPRASTPKGGTKATK